MEYNDLYDENRQPLGRRICRGEKWGPGEYILVVCCWVTDGRDRLLLTKRSPEKDVYPGYWENSGGRAQAGESSRQAIAREVREETGIRAAEEDYIFLDAGKSADSIFDFYMLVHPVPLEDIVLQKGETCDKMWAAFPEVHAMIDRGEMADPIARQFLRQEPMLRKQLSEIW